MITYRTKQGDVLDLICFRHYGKSSGAVELVLNENRKLPEHGSIIAEGTLITLPDLPSLEDETKQVELWD